MAANILAWSAGAGPIWLKIKSVWVSKARDMEFSNRIYGDIGKKERNRLLQELGEPQGTLSSCQGDAQPSETQF